MNNFNPVIEIDDEIIKIGESVSISAIASVSDKDGDAIETYRFYNPAGGGFFSLDGVDMGAGAYFDVSATDISKLRYHAGPSVGSEVIRSLVYDGDRWSNEDLATFYSVRNNTTRPDITADSSFEVMANEKVLLSNYFSASDSDGYPIIRYKFRDVGRTRNGGYIEVNGRASQQGAWTYVNAHLMDSAYYVASRGKQSETLLVRAFDGAKWSAVDRIRAHSLRNANRSIVSTDQFTIRSETSVDLLDTFQVRDEDQNTMKLYRFLDTNGQSDSGYIEVNGRKKQSNRWITISADEMADARFIASEGALTEKVRVRVYDGRFWSRIKTIDFKSLPDPTLEVNDDVILDEFEVIPITDVIVRQADEGPRIVDYEFIDMNEDPQSGYLELDGQRLASGVIHNIDQAEFSRLNFVAGADHQRSWDEIKVRANNRAGVNNFFVGEWKNMNFFSEPNSYTSLIMPNFTPDEMNSWHDHISTGPNGKLRLTFSFMQRIPIYYLDGTGPDPPEGADLLPNPVPNANQRDSIRKAIGLYRDLLDVEFVEVSDNYVDPISGQTGGILRFGTYFEDAPVLAFAYPPADPQIVPWGGDIWINNFFTDNVLSLGPDSQSFLTILHELGHTMGMNHPHEQEFGKTILSPAIDNDGITVMSYVPNPNGTAARNLMPYDARFLGTNYGYNSNTRTGDDTYSWDSVRFSDMIYDAGGDQDTIDASNQSRGAVITLQQGQYSSIGFVEENVAIAHGTVIENAIGTGSDDELHGNEVANILRAGAGDDVIHGAGGNDEYFGGSGDDRYIYKVGDQHNIINEDKQTGRDLIEVQMGNRFGLDDFSEDITFQRLGRDLLVEFKTEGDDFRSGSLLIKNQLWGGSRVETLRMYNDDGSQNGVSIDLTSVFVQSDRNSQAFATTNVRGQYGFLVAPV